MPQNNEDAEKGLGGGFWWVSKFLLLWSGLLLLSWAFMCVNAANTDIIQQLREPAVAATQPSSCTTGGAASSHSQP